MPRRRAGWVTGIRNGAAISIRSGAAISIRSGAGILLGLSIGFGGVTGCASTAPAPEPQLVVEAPPPPPPEPTLPTAGDAQLTVFGELPDQPRIPFQSSTAAPMEQHTFATEGADFDPDLSPDGKWIVFSSTRHTAKPNLYLKTINGRAVTQLTGDPSADVQPAFSPDGRSVIFASDRSGNWDLWMVGLEGGQATQITRSPMHEIHPSFAPDGQRLVFCLYNERGRQWELWTLQLDKPASRKMIGVGLFPRWSPVTDTIVYQRARERGGRWFSIWRVDLERGEPKFPVELAASSDMAFIQPSWSPDGRWVTYGTARLGTGDDFPAAGAPVMSQGDVWIVADDGTSPMQLTDGQGAHFGPVWGPDGRVYCTSLQNGIENIWSVKPSVAPVDGAPTAQGLGSPDAQQGG